MTSEVGRARNSLQVKWGNLLRVFMVTLIAIAATEIKKKLMCKVTPFSNPLSTC